MRDRRRQRANRRMNQEVLSMRIDMGIQDPPPYLAVKHMVEQEKKAAKFSNKKGVA